MAQKWYESAFGTHYSELYAHRDDKDAQRAIDFVLRHLAADVARGPVLDLCCGSGRHALELLRRTPAELTGLDLSPNLLSDARRRASKSQLPLRLARGDMRRLPFAEGSFHVVLNLFTSFGYFEDEVENEAVLAEVARVLRPGGYLILDHMNPQYLAANLKKESTRATPSGVLVLEARTIDWARRRVEKKMVFMIDYQMQQLFESVRFYTAEEMQAMAARAGLRLASLHGGFDDSPLTPESPRAIYLFQLP